MDIEMKRLLKGLELKIGAAEDLIDEIETILNVRFPADYTEFLLLSNGASGFVGRSYLLIWPLEDIQEINRLAATNEFAPGLIIFGSDGGGMSYAFDTRGANLSFVEVPSIGMSIKETKPCGQTFHDFLRYLFSKQTT